MPIVNMKRENVNVDSVENNLAARRDEGDTRKMCMKRNIMRVFSSKTEVFLWKRVVFFSLKDRGFF